MHNEDGQGADHGTAYGQHGDVAPHHGHRSFTESFLVPLAVPLVGIVVIAAIVLSVSQILLALPSAAATAVAMVIALLVLFGCAYVATAKRIGRGLVYLAVAVPAVVLFGAGIGSGIYRQANPQANEVAGEGAVAGKNAPGNNGQAPAPEVTADNKFSATSYTVEAGKETTISVQNNGKAVHNFHILGVQDSAGSDIKTELLQPGASAKLTFAIGTAGSYKFQCDVHPTEMIGNITVTPSNSAATAATAASGPAGNAEVELTTDNKFSKTTITVEHGVSSALQVQNKGTALHNWHVLNQKNPDGSDIKTELVVGGTNATITYQLDQPGTYPFQCDVHPAEMKGNLVVK